MRPAVALFLGVFLCGALASGAGDAGKKAGKEDHKRLLGEWEYVEQIIDGGATETDDVVTRRAVHGVGSQRSQPAAH